MLCGSTNPFMSVAVRILPVGGSASLPRVPQNINCPLSASISTSEPVSSISTAGQLWPGASQITSDPPPPPEPPPELLLALLLVPVSSAVSSDLVSRSSSPDNTWQALPVKVARKTRKAPCKDARIKTSYPERAVKTNHP